MNTIISTGLYLRFLLSPAIKEDFLLITVQNTLSADSEEWNKNIIFTAFTALHHFYFVL